MRDYSECVVTRGTKEEFCYDFLETLMDVKITDNISSSRLSQRWGMLNHPISRVVAFKLLFSESVAPLMSKSSSQSQFYQISTD
jgi:hypothetical protein